MRLRCRAFLIELLNVKRRTPMKATVHVAHTDIVIQRCTPPVAENGEITLTVIFTCFLIAVMFTEFRRERCAWNGY